MCTAAVYKTKDFYFGRTLDYEFSYGDEITIVRGGGDYCTSELSVFVSVSGRDEEALCHDRYGPCGR